MRLPDPERRSTRILVALLILFSPLLVLLVTLSFLLVTGDLVAGELTLVEFLELYLLELVLLVLFGYVVYRLTLYVVKEEAVRSSDGE